MYVERKSLGSDRSISYPTFTPAAALRSRCHSAAGSWWTRAFREHTAISRALGLNLSFILIKDAPSSMLGLNSKGKKEGKKGKVLSSFFIFFKEWRCPLEKSHTIVLNLAP